MKVCLSRASVQNNTSSGLAVLDDAAFAGAQAAAAVAAATGAGTTADSAECPTWDTARETYPQQQSSKEEAASKRQQANSRQHGDTLPLRGTRQQGNRKPEIDSEHKQQAANN